MATMDGQQLNGSVTSRIAYAAPSITSVTILQQTFTTAGGVDVLIQGSDIYGPVSITFGASNEFVMTPKNLNASFATARTSLTAALGAGCGSSVSAALRRDAAPLPDSTLSLIDRPPLLLALRSCLSRSPSLAKLPPAPALARFRSRRRRSLPCHLPLLRPTT